MGISRRKFISRSAMGSLAIPFAKSNFNAENRADKPVTNPQETFSILCLGSGAADWDVKKYPQDKDILLSGAYRGQSSVLINNSILVDCGVTVPAALDIFGVNVDTITDIVITHTHGDHFNVESIKKIVSKRSKQNKLNLWIEYRATSYFKTLEKDTGCAVKPIKCFEGFSINEIEIMPVEANHFRADTGEQCLHYIFTTANKSLFYALDGGWFTTKTWNLLKKTRLDAIIWDATWGSDVYYCIFSHNSIPAIHLMKKQLFKDQVLIPDSKVIVSHLSKNSHPSHGNVATNMKTEQIITAYDGAEFSI
jgi:phosphoribosyl 1,2-cyclic phosphate phosphodiesterase